MKAAGVIVLIFGCLLFVSATNLAIRRYDLSTSDGFSQAMGGFVFAILVVAGGIALYKRGTRPAPPS